MLQATTLSFRNMENKKMYSSDIIKKTWFIKISTSCISEAKHHRIQTFLIDTDFQSFHFSLYCVAEKLDKQITTMTGISFLFKPLKENDLLATKTSNIENVQCRAFSYLNFKLANSRNRPRHSKNRFGFKD